MSRHALIIGAGVVGLCCGHYLIRQGVRVTFVDRAGPDHQGCSYGNAGMIVPSHFVPLAAPGMVGAAMRMMLNSRSPFFIRPRFDLDLFNWMLKFHRAANANHVAKSAPLLRDLSLASRACFEDLAALFDDEFELKKNGLLMLCKTAHGLREESSAAGRANELGIAARVLSPQQAAEIEPGMKLNIAGAVYYPLDCHFSPDRLMAGLRRRLAKAGAEFLWNTAVEGFRAEHGKVLAARAADGNELPADEFILCGGSWSGQIARDLGLKLPMQPGKGYSLTLESPPVLPKTCMILTEARVAVTPMGDRLRFGGTMEMSGMNHKINPRRVEGIINSACEYYPGISPTDFKNIAPWCGLRPCSPDGLPYLGRTKQMNNLVVATGHAMMGMSLGPISGKIVSQIVVGERGNINITALDPDRYA